MTLERKTPKARREARSYCRRCLAVMLCCVLVFGMTVRVTPRARANAAVGTAGLIGVSGQGAAASGALATNPVGAALGLLLLVGAGLPITAGYVGNEDSIFYGTKGYEIGADCWDYLWNLGGDIYDWCSSTRSAYEEKGGIAAGDKIVIPAAVAEAVRLWAGENINFADGSATYTQHGIFSADVNLVFTVKPDDVAADKWVDINSRNFNMGTILDGNKLWTMTLTDENGGIWQYYEEFDGSSYRYNEIRPSGYHYEALSGSADYFFWAYQLGDKYYLCPGTYSVAMGQMYFNLGYRDKALPGNRFCIPAGLVSDVPTTLTKTPALDEPKTQDMAVTVPADIPTTQVGDVTVPVVGALAPEDVLDGTGETDKPRPDVTPWDRILDGLEGIEGKVGSLSQDIADAIAGAWPITGSLAGDQTVEQVMTEPDSLGAVFISKFPFSIPWDIYKAIKLLAAPPVTPYWEVDIYAPMEGFMGFHAKGSTAFVIDFTRFEFLGQLCRWTSTLFFIYALATATKRYIWTA